ncbi:Hypothetical protein NCDO2118_1679 [Lactococcus lactis subsp. lactis NCDO 2118]|uniref:Phage protein n=1 Tax=Lactococcus lactis subsp. lactis NCDO 2118 TaxID=1117941 RepID=A0ABC8A7G6_LACLL|nr:DUF1642 domain-containing protein [Lactococcus lactis]AII13138.1 Hypothetical protein NCDO2118_1679 [Lactococcus lactis subsp. lactis NCDO 2118]
MTKFEEKLEKLPIKNIEHPVGDTKYYAAVHVKTLIAQADEEFHELSEKLDDTNDALVIAQNSRDEFEREYKKLKSQLQEQALPVVPECVAEWYEEHKDDLDYSIYSLCEEFDDTEPNREPTEFESWFDIVSNQPILTLVGMRDGYTVEKPQLFYLKNKIELEDVGSDLIGYLNLFLTNGGYLTNNINRAKKIYPSRNRKHGNWEL